MTARFPRIAAALAVIVTPALLRAQTTHSDTTSLRPVVVTATRLTVRQAAPTVSTTVIRGDELRAEGITTVQEALQQIPGVFAPQTSSYGSQTSLYLRGGQSDYTQVMIDGVPINDPGGAIDLANLTTDNVDRIEIVRGPASVLYGANAATGVVQIFTRDGSDRPHLTASANGGTYGTSNLDATLAAGGERATGSLAVGRHRSDGIYDFNSQNRNDVFSGLLRLAPDASSNVRVALRYIDAGAHIPTNSSGAAADSDQFHLERRWIGSLDAGHFFTPRLEARLLLGATNGNTRSAQLPNSAADTACDFCYDSRMGVYRRSADARINVYATKDLVLTGGGSYEHQREHTFGSNPLGRDIRAYYAQAVGNLRNAFSYTLGARVDDNSAFGTFTTYRAAAGYRFVTGTSVHASFGTAFTEPTFEETSANTPYDIGNPALRPERTRSWDAGVAQDVARGLLRFSATYFNQHFRDLIQYNPAPPTTSTPNYINLAAANATGVELEAHATLAHVWSAIANYTYLDSRVIDAGVDAGPGATYVAGQRLLRRPTNVANLTLGFAPSARGSLHLAVGYVGNRVDIDFRNFVRVEAPAYTKLDLSGEWDVLTTRASAVALTARVDNLLDARYQAIYGFRAPGRVVLVGAALR